MGLTTSGRRGNLPASLRSVAALLLAACTAACSYYPASALSSEPGEPSVRDIGPNEPFGRPVAELDPAEREYLRGLGAITMCVDPDWEPYERIDERGAHEGIAAELVRLIAERSGVELRLVTTRDWNESIAASKSGACLVLSCLNETPDRDEWLVFTEPYFADPNVFITREEHDFISDPARLSGESVALPAGTSIEERIRRDYPNLRIVIVDSESQAFAMVSERKADMSVRSLTMAAFTIKKDGLFNLKIAGQVPSYVNELRLGVAKDHPMLRDILDKGVRTVSQQEVQRVVNEFISINAQTVFDYKLFFRILIGFIVLAAIGAAWAYQLARLNRRLKESENRYRLLVETANEGIVVIQDGRLKFANPMSRRLTDRTEAELVQSPFVDLVHPDDRDMVKENHARRLDGEPADLRYRFRLLRKGGEIRWVETSGARMRWEGRVATLNFLVEITEQKRLEDRLEREAGTDMLTGIANRRRFLESAQAELNRSLRFGRILSIALIDIDSFKQVNDGYGHAAGDAALVAFTEACLAGVRDIDLLARFGGGQFILLLPETAAAQALATIDRVRESVAALAIEASGHTVGITISSGVASLSGDADTVDAIIARADAALYRAKALGKNQVQPAIGDT